LGPVLGGSLDVAHPAHAIAKLLLLVLIGLYCCCQNDNQYRLLICHFLTITQPPHCMLLTMISSFKEGEMIDIEISFDSSGSLTSTLLFNSVLADLSALRCLADMPRIYGNKGDELTNTTQAR